jgi:signal transduction histidine kinase
VRDPEEGLTGQPPASSLLSRVGDLAAENVVAFGLERWARLGAVAAVPLLAPAAELREVAPLFAALAAYVLVTALARRDHRIRAADLVAAAAIIALTGGQIAPFLFFLVVAVAGPASAGGVKAGLASGGALSAVLLTTLAWYGELPQLGLGDALPAALLLPLTGITTAAAAQVLEDRVVQDRRVLQEANRLLSSLRAIADDIPGGLDVSTVSAAILAEIRSVEGASAAIVFAEEQGVLQPAATSGFTPGQVPSLRVDELRAVAVPSGTAAQFLTPRGLPAPLQLLARPHPLWAVVGVGRDGTDVGVLLIGFDDLELGRKARPRLASIAADGALALENARLFDGTRVRAADAARRRIAGDLHDGVAQSLAHIRMELELLALDGDAPDPDEVKRLARVAGSALEDLRATIGGLRRPLDGDLAMMIERHLDDVRSPGGPQLIFAAGDRPIDLDPAHTADVLRVLQEAVSNALRHARATRITVSLEQEDEQLVLAVEDDGIGVDGRTVRPGSGVGLPSMQERATELGGELEVLHRVGGGTIVLLRCPVEANASGPPLSNPLRTGR